MLWKFQPGSIESSTSRVCKIGTNFFFFAHTISDLYTFPHSKIKWIVFYYFHESHYEDMKKRSKSEFYLLANDHCWCFCNPLNHRKRRGLVFDCKFEFNWDISAIHPTFVISCIHQKPTDCKQLALCVDEWEDKIYYQLAALQFFRYFYDT